MARVLAAETYLWEAGGEGGHGAGAASLSAGSHCEPVPPSPLSLSKRLLGTPFLSLNRPPVHLKSSTATQQKRERGGGQVSLPLFLDGLSDV
jgi:hypothetical protein